MKIEHQLSIRKALRADIDSILSIFNEARNFQRASGFVQWIDGYPNREVVERDIAADTAYIVEIGATPAGYFFIAFDDAGYNEIENIWNCDGRFAVVHRLAISDEMRGKGLAAIIFARAEGLAAEGGAKSMRVDTGAANVRMHRLMNRLGYDPKGELVFPWGPRLTFEKALRNQDKTLG